MKKLLAVLAIGISVLSLSGCAGNFGITEKFTETNAMIAEANQQSRRAYAEAMAACGTNAACQVGMSASYFSGAGQQQFFRPETVKDYLVAFMPYATLGVDVFRLWHAPVGDSQGMVITGDGNTLMGIGNKITADNQSSASASFAAEIDNSSHSYVQRDSRSSSIGEGYVQDVENPVDDHSTGQ